MGSWIHGDGNIYKEQEKIVIGTYIHLTQTHQYKYTKKMRITPAKEEEQIINKQAHTHWLSTLQLIIHTDTGQEKETQTERERSSDAYIPCAVVGLLRLCSVVCVNPWSKC